MLIGTLAASTTTTINLNYLPAYLYFVAATTPTTFQVNVAGDGVIANLDDDGVDMIGTLNRQNRVSNSFLIPLADGLIKGKNVDITITNAVAGTVSVYGFSVSPGATYIQHLSQTVYANSGASFDNLAAYMAPNAGTTDLYTVTYRNGTVQQFNRIEMLPILGASQAVVLSNSYVFNNYDQTIRMIQVTPAANQTVYVTRFIPVGGVTDSAIFDK